MPKRHLIISDEIRQLGGNACMEGQVTSEWLEFVHSPNCG